MNGTSEMEGVAGGRAAGSQFTFRSMEYGEGRPLCGCRAGGWKRWTKTREYIGSDFTVEAVTESLMIKGSMMTLVREG